MHPGNSLSLRVNNTVHETRKAGREEGVEKKRGEKTEGLVMPRLVITKTSTVQHTSRGSGTQESCLAWTEPELTPSPEQTHQYQAGLSAQLLSDSGTKQPTGCGEGGTSTTGNPQPWKPEWEDKVPPELHLRAISQYTSPRA